MFGTLFANDPWAKVLDCLIRSGYADETVVGNISNKKSFALETLVGPSGKIGISFVDVIGSTPCEADIYAYWMRVARIGREEELRVISSETGFSNRWFMSNRVDQAFREFERDVASHNREFTRLRRMGRQPARRYSEGREFDLTPEQNPLFVAPSMELRVFLDVYYSRLGGKNIATLSLSDGRKIAQMVRDALRR